MSKNKSSNKFLLLLYSHPRIAVASVLILINIIVVFLFTGILSIIRQTNFFSELAYCFVFTMSSDGLYDFFSDKDVFCLVIKILLALIQMIIFSGALIGFTTDVLSSMFDKRLENRGKLHLKNHFVILNWSNIGPNIVYELSYLEGEKTIVILSENERETVINSIDNLFTLNKKKKKNIRIFVKKGDPNSTKYLSDISIESAKCVGILLADKEDTISDKNGISTKDLHSFKLLMSIINISGSSNIVVESETNETVEKIEKLLKLTNPEVSKRISLFSHNSIIGHVLGRSVTNPVFSHLFHEIFAFKGVEFYSIPIMDISEALKKYNDCIPIINYDDDDLVDENGNKQADSLYVLSDEASSLGERKKYQNFVKPLKFKCDIKKQDFTLYILSDSNRAEFVIQEIESHNRTFNTHIVCKNYSYKSDLNILINDLDNDKGVKKILFLSGETDDINSQDADIFVSLLELKLRTKLIDGIEIYSEVVNPNNLKSLQNLGVVSIIVSNKIISLFMIQLLTHPHSRKFYRDVIMSNEVDISGCSSIDFDIVKASEVLDFDGSLTFETKSEFVQSFYEASNHKYMVIGIRKSSDPIDKITFLCDNMDKPMNLEINSDDELIIVTY